MSGTPPSGSVEALRAEALAAVEAATTAEAVEALRSAWLGRSGRLQDVLRGIGALPPEQRGPVGKAANEAKGAVEAAIDVRLAALRSAHEGALADREWVDPTMPLAAVAPAAAPAATGRGLGLVHPVSGMRRELEDICLSMGLEVLDGPWVEDEWHNFEALNIPRDHPARDSHDTTWLEDGNLLRTHTSPVQIRTMATRKPPIRAVAVGRVFRHEALDASHENTFHQLEGIFVDRDVHVGHLVSTLRTLLGEVFRRDVEVRLRPSFFPFTEPSFELDVRCLVCGGTGCAVCKRTGWVELLGCGLIHPNVLRAGGIDPATWSGFAFGLGVDRLTMMRHGIEDIRHFAAGDLRFLRQFAGGLVG
ncbi:MAG: phenylalanine--tRNA ligase subunit alpha [Planctomycetes bacterium]|nr:phenylalanine--tRNA ligase subunit alpha [Planctomycetota bacterium]